MPECYSFEVATILNKYILISIYAKMVNAYQRMHPLQFSTRGFKILLLIQNY
jgi:hypothetical protein